jgi:hypothetical protein
LLHRGTLSQMVGLSRAWWESPLQMALRLAGGGSPQPGVLPLEDSSPPGAVYSKLDGVPSRRIVARHSRDLWHVLSAQDVVFSCADIPQTTSRYRNNVDVLFWTNSGFNSWPLSDSIVASQLVPLLPKSGCHFCPSVGPIVTTSTTIQV